MTATKHSSRQARDFPRITEYHSHELATVIPDLNPIENIWAQFKRRIPRKLATPLIEGRSSQDGWERVDWEGVDQSIAGGAWSLGVWTPLAHDCNPPDYE